MITDTHCHLASHRFEDSEVPQLVENARNRGVKRMICIGTDVNDSAKGIQFSKTYDHFYATVGIHPTDVTDAPKNSIEIISKLAKENPKEVVAIGETGLDYYHPAPKGIDEDTYHQMQKNSLEKHFELAAELNLNIVIHTRDKSGLQSFDDALEIYARYAERVRAVFHCFSFDEEQAQRIFALGGLISFTGIITYKRPPESIDLAFNLPASHFMLETDSPYLAPIPHRGKRNEPGFTRDIFEFIASKRTESSEELSQKLEKTVEKFFKLP